MKFAILAAGGIARKMAEAVTGIEKAGTVRIQKYAVASRDLSRAEEFAKEWGFEKAYGSYEELAADPEVELVYVASPHSHHYEHAKLCLEHGKHVLVEKAFTVNAAQAEDLMKLAREKQVLLTEAIWTRYMPSRKMIGDLLESGIIGKVSSMTANLGYPLMDVPRLVQPELAGGALLDLGVYSITMALMLFHEEITDVVSAAVFSPEGVDWMNSITLTFADGKMAVLNSNMTARTDCRAIVNGDEGYMEITEINNPEEIRIRAIGEGKMECEEMPHSETLRVMRLMDQIRGQWGFRLPCE